MFIVSAALAIALAQAPAQGLQLVNDSAAVTGCDRLGEVNASSLLGGAMANMGYERTLRKAKADAVKLGATHLQLLNISKGMTGSNVLGVAFRCPSSPGPAE
jgi:hypothetical protein